MPKSIRIATWLYVTALVISLYANGYLGIPNSSDSIALFLMAKAAMLLLAAPIIAFQGFLFYKIWKRRGWARYALLIFVAFILYREVSTFRLALTFGIPRSLQALLGPLTVFASAVLQLASLAFLFSAASRHWFNENDAGASGQNAVGVQSGPWSPGIRSIVVGVLVSAGVLGGVILFSHMGAKAIGGNEDELKPGNQSYPAEVATPVHVIPLIVSGLEYGDLSFRAGYSSDVKLCGHNIWPGGYYAYGLSVPIALTRTADGKYRGDIVIDKFQPGHCGWTFTGVSYVWPKGGGGNAIGIFNEHPEGIVSPTPHIDMWCYKVTEGQFKSADPQCEILALLRWPNAVRRISPEFLAQFSHQQQSANGNSPINNDTKALFLELHDLNAIPGALVPVGDREDQLKAAQEADAYRDATPEYKALKCEQAANLEYVQSHKPLPDTATQMAALKAIKDKCRAESNSPPVSSESSTNVVQPKTQDDASAMAEKCGQNSFDAWLRVQTATVTPEEKATKLQESLQNCRSALGLAPAAMRTPTPGLTQGPAVMRVPSSATDTVATANAMADRLTREAAASQCERDESQKLAWFWKQKPDETTRAAKVREIMHNCLMSQHLPDSDATRPTGN